MLIPIKYNLRNLARRWPVTALTAFTFALVVGVFVIVMALATGIEKTFTTSGDPLNVLALRSGAKSEGQSSVMIERYQIIRGLKGVARDDAGEPLAVPETIALINRPKKGDSKPTNLQIRGVHPLSFKLRPDVRIVEGRVFEPGRRELIVSKSVAERFTGDKPGEGFEMGMTPFLGKGNWTVVGVFDAGGTAFGSEVWTDYQELMEEFDRNAYNTVMIRAIDVGAVESIIRELDEDERIKLEGITETDYYAGQTVAARPIKFLGVFLAIVMSVGACFAGMNTMYAMVANRSREIGVLRVLGFPPRSIMTSFVLESILLAMIGGAMGCVLAWGYLEYRAYAGSQIGTTNFRTFSEVVFNFRVTPQLVGLGMGFAFLMGLIGGLAPALAAARQTIISTLRQA